MKSLSLILFILILTGNILHSQTFCKGGDFSYVKELEGCGVQWKENNTAKDILEIFKDNGANVARFRIWHTPTTGKNGYSDTESMIARAKALGFKVILDFHYSDTWADPAKQKCPAAWVSVINNNSLLADSLYNYTKKTLQSLKDKGLMPEFVQVGNETNGGMCFPGDGTVTWPTVWSKQTLLFNAGIKAVRDVDANTKIILHVADPKNAEWWAGELKNNNVTGYDIMGISFYPTYHTTNTINSFGTIITNIKNTFHKDVMVVETGLPWTNLWDDNTNNMMNGVPTGYGSIPTPEIQAQWLIDLTNKMISSGGIGVVYWEPDWVASNIPGCPAEWGGSTWENIALFDFNNNLMANGGIKFCQLITGINTKTELAGDISLTISPNPADSEISIQFVSKSTNKAELSIYDLQGHIVKKISVNPVIGSNKLNMKIVDLQTVAGLHVLRLTLNGVAYNQSFVIVK